MIYHTLFEVSLIWSPVLSLFGALRPFASSHVSPSIHAMLIW